MRVIRLWLDADLQPGRTIELPPDRFNYLKNVLRLRDGFSVTLFDGRGHQAEGRLQLERRAGRVAIQSVEARSLESPLQTRLFQAMAKGERMDWVIQKAVELGVDRITPVTTARSVVELDENRAAKRQLRFREIAINACEQCGRNHLPVIDPIRSLAGTLTEVDTDLRWVLHPLPAGTSRPEPAQPPRSASLLIGPEGGLTDEELTLAAQHGFLAAQIGPRVLRTETAGMVALSLLQAEFGDLAPRTGVVMP